MKLSPIDLRQVRFRTALRGFDPEEVRRFLDLVRSEMESLRQENEALKGELQQALRRLAEFREQERLLREALLTAQRVGDELKANAEREAELLVSEAELKASRILSEAMHKVQRLRSETLELRQLKASLRQEIRATIERAVQWLELDEEADREVAKDEEGVHFFAPPGTDEGGARG